MNMNLDQRRRVLGPILLIVGAIVAIFGLIQPDNSVSGFNSQGLILILIGVVLALTGLFAVYKTYRH